MVAPENWKPESDVEVLLRPKSLLPYMKRLPSKRMVNLYNVSNTDTLQFQIQFNTSAERPLPPGAPNNTYSTYTITGIHAIQEKQGEGGKIVLHFITDKSGLPQVDRAEYIVETIQTEAPKGEGDLLAISLWSCIHTHAFFRSRPGCLPDFCS